MVSTSKLFKRNPPSTSLICVMKVFKLCALRYRMDRHGCQFHVN